MYNNLRYVSYEIIHEVIYENGYSNLLLKNRINHFDDKDKALLTNIVYGVLQNYDLLKYQLEFLNYNKLSKKNEVIILMSIYQKHFLDKIPDYAIINEALKIVKAISSKYEVSFVSALLNEAINMDLCYLESDDQINNLSIKYSHPKCLIKMLNKQYGEKTTLRILENNQGKGDIFVRYNPLSEKLDDLENNDLYQATEFDNAYIYKGDNIKDLPQYKDGIVSIQDLSSQQVASFLNPEAGMKVLDMCAAPGTKSTHLAELMNNKGQIDAIDIHEHKMLLINDNAERLSIDIINTKCYDATKLSDYIADETYDMILCDALCTGLGVIKRKPEIKYQDISTSMDYIISVQEQLLDQAHRLLKKGGRLVYSTCTLNKKENEKQVKKFLDKHEDLELINEKTIFNFEYNSDGFYMALILKK